MPFNDQITSKNSLYYEQTWKQTLKWISTTQLRFFTPSLCLLLSKCFCVRVHLMEQANNRHTICVGVELFNLQNLENFAISRTEKLYLQNNPKQ